ncbi:MAG: glycosyltransferase family 2 protein [Halobacteriaceae archaeon]
MAYTDLIIAFLQGFAVFAVVYYLLVNSSYLIIHIFALLELRSRKRESEWDPPYEKLGSLFFPGVAVIVPAYNEEATIVESLKSHLSIEYPDMEIVVVNDGSTDSTLETLIEAYDLEPIDADIPFDVPCEPIRSVYRSDEYQDLLVIDKENGGKNDALNAGVWLTEKELFCSVDADTIMTRQSLLQVLRPYLKRPKKTVAAGGTIRVANRCTIRNGQVVDVNMPTNPLVGIQVMEYLRAFYSGRLGYDRFQGLILVSGAFGMFKTNIAREIGGFRRETVTEDFDFVLRLHRYMITNDREYNVSFVPEPIAWTEVPESVSMLSRQRRRWFRGKIDTLVNNIDLVGNRENVGVGIYALPLFWFAEALGPLIEGLGYVLFPLMLYFGLIDIYVFVLFFLATSVFGVLLSWFSIYSEAWAFRRYGSVPQTLLLFWYGIIENFGYRQLRTYFAWRGLIDYLRSKDSWGHLERTGFGDQSTQTTDD